MKGLPYGGSRNALIEYEFRNGCLYLLVAAGGQQSRGEISFPAVSLVENFSRGILQEFKDRLVVRKAGPKMDADNLIRACVAFLLRASGSMKGRAEIEKLLNDYVLCEIQEYMPVGTSAGPNEKLWETDILKVQKQIVRVLAGI